MPVRKVSVELFTDGSNNAVVRMPGRKFPGVVVQGDTLAYVVARLREIEGLVPEGSADLADVVEEVRAQLESMLDRYERALELANIELPYVKP